MKLSFVLLFSKAKTFKSIFLFIQVQLCWQPYQWQQFSEKMMLIFVVKFLRAGRGHQTFGEIFQFCFFLFEWNDLASMHSKKSEIVISVQFLSGHINKILLQI